MKKRFSEEQIISFLHEAEASLAVKDLCRKNLVLPVAQQVVDLSLPDARRLQELETENTKLKKLLAE